MPEVYFGYWHLLKRSFLAWFTDDQTDDPMCAQGPNPRHHPPQGEGCQGPLHHPRRQLHCQRQDLLQAHGQDTSWSSRWQSGEEDTESLSSILEVTRKPVIHLGGKRRSRWQCYQNWQQYQGWRKGRQIRRSILWWPARPDTLAKQCADNNIIPLDVWKLVSENIRRIEISAFSHGYDVSSGMAAHHAKAEHEYNSLWWEEEYDAPLEPVECNPEAKKYWKTCFKAEKPESVWQIHLFLVPINS